MTGRLQGKVALVTGGSSGMGRATALAFAQEGAKVVVASRRTKEGEETRRRIEETKGEGAFVRTDVTKAAEVEALVKKTVETYGRLDCAFNNAGVLGTVALTAEQTEQDFDEVLSTNLKGTWLCMKFEILQMLKQGGGVIVNNASAVGLQLIGFQGLPAYVASKHGLIGLTKAAALEYAKSGLRINVVCPGATRTEMTESFIKVNPDVEAQLIAKEPIGRLARPEEIAEAVVWLCSDAASFVTGHAMLVEGGMSLL